MANADHIALVKQGESAVNEWHREFPDLVLDLSGADLSRAKLKRMTLLGANLSGAILKDANLDGADLTNARLDHATLIGARLVDAILDETSLRDADCQRANLINTAMLHSDLTRADLRGANLCAARLINCECSATKFHGAFFGMTTLASLDLRRALGLGEVEHRSPSSFGIDTLLRCGEHVPHAFLLGCGVPQCVLDYLPSIVGSLEPIQFYSCFISYSSKDDPFAHRLHGRLEQEGLRVWFAPEDMKGGRKSYDQIEEAIRVHDKLLVVLSEASMQSEWVKTEIRRARLREIKEKRQVLFPIRLVDFDTIKAWSAFDAETGKDMAVEIREYHIPDLSNWKDHDSFEVGFKRLLADLKKSAEPAGGTVPR